jgi:hypothetical protein
MRYLVLQVAGLAAVVAGLFLFSSFAGQVGLLVAGVLLIVIGWLEELDGTRSAPPTDQHQGGP